MKLAVNARLFGSPDLRGIQRYTINLLNHLPDSGIELVLYLDRPPAKELLGLLDPNKYVLRVAPPMKYPTWEQHWLPRQCAIDRVDILHAPANFGLPFWAPCATVLTLHDAIDQAYALPRMKRSERLKSGHLKTVLHHWCARIRADRIITVSQHAKKDLVRRLGVDSEKISVIYEAADARFSGEIESVDRNEVRHLYNLDRPYILYLGGWESRKNVLFLMESFSEAHLEGIDLVFAGGGEIPRSSLETSASQWGVGSRFRILGRVEDRCLPALYAEALCFVHPSRYEGFGLQLCEAMGVGCPILAARCTSLPEILGHGGDTFDLESRTELVTLLRTVAGSPDYRLDLSQRARVRSQEFSWARTAQQTTAVYEEVIRSRKI